MLVEPSEPIEAMAWVAIGNVAELLVNVTAVPDAGQPGEAAFDVTFEGRLKLACSAVICRAAHERAAVIAAASAALARALPA